MVLYLTVTVQEQFCSLEKEKRTFENTTFGTPFWLDYVGLIGGKLDVTVKSNYSLIIKKMG